MTAHARSDTRLYIVEVDDRCDPSSSANTGYSYAGPPQAAAQALALVGALLGCPQNPLSVHESPWRHAIVGGTRTIRLHAAPASGRLPCSRSPQPAGSAGAAAAREPDDTPF